MVEIDKKKSQKSHPPFYNDYFMLMVIATRKTVIGGKSLKVYNTNVLQ